MGTQTPTLLLAKPTVNGPETANNWGVDINLNFDKIDAWTGPLPARIAALETGAASGVPEAPNDGQTYGRKSLGWSALDLTVDWAEILGKPTTFPPAGHTHVIPDVTGLQGALDTKAPLASPALTGLPTAPTAAPATNTTQLATTAFVGAAVAAGGGILEAPNDGQTYGRKSLGWTILDVTPAWSELSGVPATFPPSVHTHVIADVTGLQTALNAKADLASPGFTGNPTAPTPAQADNDTSIATTAFVTTALSTAVGGKISEAPNDGQTYGRKSLGWSVLDITPDWTELLNKPATFPPSVHTHVIADVTGLQPALDAKAPLAGPVFTGDPQAPTPATADNDTSIATTAFVKAQGYGTTAADNLRVLKAGDSMTGQLSNAVGAGGIGFSTSAGAYGFSASAATFTGFYATGCAIGLRIENANSFQGIQLLHSGNSAFSMTFSQHADGTSWINQGNSAGSLRLSVASNPILTVQTTGLYVSPTAGTYGVDSRSIVAGGAAVIGWTPGPTYYGMSGAVQSSISYSFFGNTGAFISAGTWAVSDGRFKAVTGDLDPVQALNAVNAILVKEYLPVSHEARMYIDGREGDEPLYGWIAQDVEAILPIAVRDVGVPDIDMLARSALRGVKQPAPESREAEELAEGEVSVKAINDRYMLTTLWAAVQSLTARVAELEKGNEQLTARVAELEGAA